MNGLSERLTAALADRYRIERELGQGGMATVYLAEDLKHKRRVALKVLKPELAAVLGAERFVQEITTTAALQHPHILPLFDSGEADGFLYYVMPFIDGETLRAKLDRETQLGVDEAVRIASDVAGALHYAHAHGVIHRDIKPENIMLDDGVALLADFGIAVAVTRAGATRLTETGLSLGTPAYMSPEQVAGERHLDARSDVYALACVTYEMLAGDPPFVASHPQAVMAKHVTDPAPPITTTRPGVSTALAKSLAKALSKAPADRFDGAAAFAAAMKVDPTGGVSLAPILVVVPFGNQSPNPDNEYFVDGLTEEIIAGLSRVQGLRVISRNSAMMLKGAGKDTPTLVRELRVSHVVTGAVRRAGNALRVTAELVDGTTDTSLWNATFAGTIEDVFGIQEEIARKIVAGLELRLTPREEREVAARPIDDAVAYDYYLRARQEYFAWTPESLDRALELIDKALDIVGANPLLLAMKGQIYWQYVNVSVRPEEQCLDQAAQLADQALALDAEHYLAIFVRGLVAALRGETERALKDLYRAHEIQPGDANVRLELCRFSQSAGLRNYERHVNEQVRLDPLTAATWFGPAFSAQYNGRFAEAASGARRAIELSAANSPLRVYAAWSLASAGLREEAIPVLQRVGSRLGSSANGAWARFCAHALIGNVDEAVRQVTPALESAASRVEFFALIMSEANALIGRNDEALRWTRTAVGRGFINYPFLAQHSHFLRPVRGDQRFQRLLEEVRPRWEAVVAWERSFTGFDA